MKTALSLFAATACVLGVVNASRAEDAGATLATVVALPASAGDPLYAGDRAPLRPTPFLKLPLGAVRPGGWLKRQLVLQRDGLAGHLGEISKWLTKTDNAWLSKDGHGQYGWEEVPYWLKGYVRIAYALNDPAMIAESRVWIEGALANQRPDGDFGPIVLKHGKRDLWAQMLMLNVLQSYSEVTDDPRVLPFLTRYFKWQLAVPDADFLKDYWENSRGGDNLASVYWLYARTGDAFLLDLATKIDRNTADWREAARGRLPNWHGVNVAECFREPATYALQSGKDADTQATVDAFLLMRREYGQVPGGMYGADENARTGYSDPRQAAETCAMVEQMGSDAMLLQWTGDARWADNLEDVAFNSFPAAFTPDMRALRYLTAPNMAVSDSKNHAPGIQNDGPFLMMNPFSSRCCQHNHTNGWPNYLEATWMATPDRGLAAQLFCDTRVTAKVGGGQTVMITETTKYPFDSDLDLAVDCPAPTAFPLYLRVPAWVAGGPTVSVNGQAVAVDGAAGHYVKLERTWRSGDRVVVRLPMALHARTWAANASSVSVDYGPLTFSLQIGEQYVRKSSTATAIGDSGWQKTADPNQWPSYEIVPTTPWNYALVVDPANPAASIRLDRKAWPADDNPFVIDGAPLVLHASGKSLPDWTLDRHELIQPLPPSPVKADGPAMPLTLVPMGAARLRVSAFPVARQ